jgi:hypothetical protein
LQLQQPNTYKTDITMADRERSRSPDPPAQDAPAVDNGAPAPAENGNGAIAPVGADSEGVKLYVGNLDYGTYLRYTFSAAHS